MSNKTILCVDDSATMRAIVEKTFFAEPFDVVTVPSGEVAIARAKEIKPSLILADAGMVGTTGYDVCRSVRESGEIAATPVIIMSGISSPYDEAKAKEVGATDYVKKPFDTTKLIERVVELCGAEEPAAAPAPAKVPIPAPSTPSTRPGGSTLHAFPSPASTSSPSAPVAPKPPAKPVVKETMEFPRPSVKPVEPAARPVARPEPKPAPKPEPKPEPAPIELDEPMADEGEIQVGTLAELAQMNERGEQIAHEPDEDAIELRHPTPVPAPVASSVTSAAAAAGAEIAAKVGGLTPEQADAIQALTAEVVEKVVWEVVPDLAETIIRERIEQLLEE